MLKNLELSQDYYNTYYKTLIATSFNRSVVKYVPPHDNILITYMVIQDEEVTLVVRWFFSHYGVIFFMLFEAHPTTLIITQLNVFIPSARVKDNRVYFFSTVWEKNYTTFVPTQNGMLKQKRIPLESTIPTNLLYYYYLVD